MQRGARPGPPIREALAQRLASASQIRTRGPGDPGGIEAPGRRAGDAGREALRRVERGGAERGGAPGRRRGDQGLWSLAGAAPPAGGPPQSRAGEWGCVRRRLGSQAPARRAAGPRPRRRARRPTRPARGPARAASFEFCRAARACCRSSHQRRRGGARPCDPAAGPAHRRGGLRETGGQGPGRVRFSDFDCTGGALLLERPLLDPPKGVLDQGEQRRLRRHLALRQPRHPRRPGDLCRQLPSLGADAGARCVARRRSLDPSWQGGPCPSDSSERTDPSGDCPPPAKAPRGPGVLGRGGGGRPQMAQHRSNSAHAAGVAQDRRNLRSLAAAVGPPRIPGISGSAVSSELVSRHSWRAGPVPAPLWKDRAPGDS
eukprot:gene8020-biopygen3094